MRAIGVNFNVRVTGDLAATTPLFETREAFDALGIIRSQDRTDSIEIPNEALFEVDQFGSLPTTLNLTRKTDFNSMEINFNYHTLIPEVGFVTRWVEGNPIAHWRQHALGVLADCYGIADVDAAYF